MPSSLSCETANGVLTIHFHDARILDAVMIERLHRELMAILVQAQEPNVLLEFGSVQFLSSAALGLLIRMQKRCKELKKRLKLCQLAPSIRLVFKVSNLDRVFELHDTAAEALGAFQSQVEAAQANPS